MGGGTGVHRKANLIVRRVEAMFHVIPWGPKCKPWTSAASIPFISLHLSVMYICIFGVTHATTFP